MTQLRILQVPEFMGTGENTVARKAASATIY